MITFLTSLTWTFNLSEICPNALLWSSLVKQVMFFSGMEGANSFKIKALVFAGLATTKTCKDKKITSYKDYIVIETRKHVFKLFVKSHALHFKLSIGIFSASHTISIPLFSDSIFWIQSHLMTAITVHSLFSLHNQKKIYDMAMVNEISKHTNAKILIVAWILTDEIIG